MSEEKKSEEKKDASTDCKGGSCRGMYGRALLWIVIALMVVGAVIFFKQRTPNSEEQPVSDKVSQEVTARAKEIIEDNLVAPGTEVKIGKITQVSGLYKIELTVEDQEITSYMTKDKMKFIPQLIDTKELEKKKEEAKKSVKEVLKGASTELGLDEGAFFTCVDEGRYATKVEDSVQEGVEAGIQGTPYNVLVANDGTQYALPGALQIEEISKILDTLLVGGTPKEVKKVEKSVKTVDATDHIRGKKNAKVTMIEYSDLDCPFCKKHHKTMEEITTKYSDRVRFVFRHFPLDQLHPDARAKAEASECAFELGGEEVFWKYLDLMFAS